MPDPNPNVFTIGSSEPDFEEIRLTDTERRVLARTIDAVLLASSIGALGARLPRDEAQTLSDLRDRLAPRIAAAEENRGLTRAQELAETAMMAKYGRSRLFGQGDGSVVITGLVGDQPRERICIEPDGRERWREL